jgi:hypothetical protein
MPDRMLVHNEQVVHDLEDHVYNDIGRAVRAIARGYNQACQAATGKSGGPTGRRAPVARG